jgi:hypothetical protein
MGPTSTQPRLYVSSYITQRQNFITSRLKLHKHRHVVKKLTEIFDPVRIAPYKDYLDKQELSKIIYILAVPFL